MNSAAFLLLFLCSSSSLRSAGHQKIKTLNILPPYFFHQHLSPDSWHTSVKTFLNKRPAANSGPTVSQETLPWKQMLCTAHSTPAATKESVLQLEDLGSSVPPSESPPLALLKGPRARHWILISSRAAVQYQESDPDPWPACGGWHQYRSLRFSRDTKKPSALRTSLII